jgi:hypothetical protein
MIGLPRKTIFIDRNSGGRLFRDIVTAADIKVVLHDEHFPDQKTPDHVWLKEIGKLGWAMVSGDILDRNSIFLHNLNRTKAHVFILCGLNHGSPQERAECVINAYPSILQFCDQYAAPKLWKSKCRGASLQPVNFRHELGMLKRYGRI